MKTSVRHPILLGLVVTLAVLFIDQAGGFEGWERETIDLRFARAPRPPRPMTDQIVHVDIDDNAIDYYGRWPWDRSKLADVINELQRAGAGTIALDLILSDREEPDYDPAEQRAINHDGRLAQALANVNCVLGVLMLGQSRFGPIWQTPTGRFQLQRLLTILSEDIQLNAETAADQARLTEERRERFLARPMQFKKAAAMLAIQNLRFEGDELLSFEKYVQHVAPRRGRLLGSFPELVLLRHVWDQNQAWRLVQNHLLPQRLTVAFEDKAPIPEFAAQAEFVGFVTADSHRDRDGEMRSIEPVMAGMYGSSLQFGLAAAAAHLGIPLDDIEIDERSIAFGTIRLPLHNGRLWIKWPKMDADPPWHLLRQHEDEPSDAGHLPIGGLVDLAEQRRNHAKNLGKLAVVTRTVLDYAQIEYEQGQELSPEILAQARDEVQFTIEDAPEDETPTDTDEPEDQAAQDHLFHCRLWLATETECVNGRASLDAIDRQLRRLVNGKLVFIGWVATGNLGDFIPTALDAATPGVVVNAAVANMVLTGDSIEFAPPWSRIVLVFLIGIASMLIGARLSGLQSAVTVIALLTLYIWVCGVWLFAKNDVLYPMVAPLTAGIWAWIGCTSLQAVINLRERRRVTRQFKARVSTQLVEYLFEHPDALSFSGQQREITVVFGDLAGFTAISETFGGPITVTTLNRYLKDLVNILIEERAYVNKFLGDGFMAFWSAFTLDPDQASRACRAALQCHEAMDRLNSDPAYEDLPQFRLRLGISTGRVVVGDCGVPPVLNDYTVIGNAVNLAARLESANKQFNTRTLINERTRELLNDDRIVTRQIGRIQVVGQSVPTMVHEVMPFLTPPELIKITNQAVDAYARGDMDRSIERWDELVKRFGSSGLADFYHRVIQEDGDTGDGVLRLRDK